MPLRTMARCLRGNRLHVAVVIARDRFPERDIEIGAHQPVALGRLALAHFQRRGAELFAQVIGVRLERRGGFAVGGQRAAIDAERRGDQRVAEQRRPDMRERQHAHDRTILFGERVMAAVAERGRDDARPGGAMEEGAARHRRDEGVPGGSDWRHRAVAVEAPCGLVQGAREDIMRCDGFRFALPIRQGPALRRCHLGKHAVHAVPGEIAQQPVETRRHAR